MRIVQFIDPATGDVVSIVESNEPNLGDDSGNDGGDGGNDDGGDGGDGGGDDTGGGVNALANFGADQFDGALSTTKREIIDGDVFGPFGVDLSGVIFDAALNREGFACDKCKRELAALEAKLDGAETQLADSSNQLLAITAGRRKLSDEPIVDFKVSQFGDDVLDRDSFGPEVVEVARGAGLSEDQIGDAIIEASDPARIEKARQDIRNDEKAIETKIEESYRRTSELLQAAVYQELKKPIEDRFTFVTAPDFRLEKQSLEDRNRLNFREGPNIRALREILVAMLDQAEKDYKSEKQPVIEQLQSFVVFLGDEIAAKKPPMRAGLLKSHFLAQQAIGLLRRARHIAHHGKGERPFRPFRSEPLTRDAGQVAVARRWLAVRRPTVQPLRLWLRLVRWKQGRRARSGQRQLWPLSWRQLSRRPRRHAGRRRAVRQSRYQRYGIASRLIFRPRWRCEKPDAGPRRLNPAVLRSRW